MAITGETGIGKTSLARELHTLVTESNGYYIEGAATIEKRDEPYYAIIDSLNNLVNQLLIEGSESLKKWRSLIKECVGKNGKVLTDIVPNLEKIVGEQPPLEELPPIEAKLRFRRLLQEFLMLFSMHSPILVFFIDNLQYADSDSLKLIKTVGYKRR